jgi:hypothetical protein
MGPRYQAAGASRSTSPSSTSDSTTAAVKVFVTLPMRSGWFASSGVPSRCVPDVPRHAR